MSHRQAARRAPRRVRIGRLPVAALLVVLVATGHQALTSTAAAPVVSDGGDRSGAHGVRNGAVPAGTTVFSDDVPGVTRLDPALRGALRRAATAAAASGVTLDVDSGWRSAAYQERLLREAIAKYGSREQAARWVATPGRSAHVSGDAADIGSAGAEWLSAHGAVYDLCRIYANEPWHFELRRGAAGHGCPRMYADPAHDPRLQR